MTQLQERLFKLRTYHLKVEFGEEKMTVRVDYPESWESLMPSDGSVKIFRDKEKENRYYYQAEATASLDAVLDQIDQVVKVNREAELKLTLFNNKIEELRQLFLDQPYESLRNLRFDLRPLEPVCLAREDKKRRPTKKNSAAKPTAMPEPTEADPFAERPLDSAPSAAEEIASQYV